MLLSGDSLKQLSVARVGGFEWCSSPHQCLQMLFEKPAVVLKSNHVGQGLCDAFVLACLCFFAGTIVLFELTATNT